MQARVVNGHKHHQQPWCQLATYGSEWGAHALCNISAYLATEKTPCTLISVGIGHDASFDSELASAHGCAGLALDPTVRSPANLCLLYCKMTWTTHAGFVHSGPDACLSGKLASFHGYAALITTMRVCSVP